MTWTRPGRLYRKLTRAGLTTRPVLEVSTERTGTIGDSDIREVKIRRGKSSAGGGADPAIATVSLKGSGGLQYGGDVAVRLGDDFAAELAARIGQTPERLAPRFFGRFGPMRTTDNGRTLWDEFEAVSWIAQASISSWSISLTAGITIPSAVRALLTPPGELKDKITLEFPGAWDTLHEPQPDATYEDTAPKLTRDIGVLLAPLRDGGNRLINMPWRRDRALDNLTASVALGRRHVLAPTTWEQPTEAPGDVYRVRWTDETGASRLSVTDDGDPATYAGRVTELDWRYVRFYTEQWRHMFALSAQSSTSRFTIPTVTIDLLALVTSPLPWDRRVAALLLVLESGDHVYLGGDWPGTFAGIYFAEGITETISGDSWTIELALVPYTHVTGTQTPDIQPYYWDQVNGTWDSQTATWNTISA